MGSVVRRAGPAMQLAVEEARRFGEEHKAAWPQVQHRSARPCHVDRCLAGSWCVNAASSAKPTFFMAVAGRQIIMAAVRRITALKNNLSARERRTGARGEFAQPDA
jgi:hypothetical protein